MCVCCRAYVHVCVQHHVSCRYSTLAGFLEIGESLEQALCREVLEESGVAADLHSVRWGWALCVILSVLSCCCQRTEAAAAGLLVGWPRLF